VTHAVVLGVEASTPSRGVPPAVDDVAGVAVASVPASVTDSLPYGNSPDALVHRGCPRAGRYGCFALRRWGCVHGNLTVLVCSPITLLRGLRAHARRRTLGLLHGSLLDELLCLAAQVATRGCRWLGHSLEKVSRSDELLARRLQFRGFVDVVVGQDALPGNTSRRLGMCTTRGMLLLECGAQLLGLLTLLVELDLKLLELCQLSLSRRRA